jgi:hypothetical protein
MRTVRTADIFRGAGACECDDGPHSHGWQLRSGPCRAALNVTLATPGHRAGTLRCCVGLVLWEKPGPPQMVHPQDATALRP